VKKTRQNENRVSFDLIIFDFDGVLVDSEVISCRVHADVLTRYGYPITAEQVRQRFLGRSAYDATAEVERELGRTLAETYDLERRTTLLAALADTVEAIPHLCETLAAITARSAWPPAPRMRRFSRRCRGWGFTGASRRIFFREPKCVSASRRPICFCSQRRKCRPRPDDVS
jgi:beta-phosphoglucomutase-like phosphatase (HAD superfamily)